MSKRKHSNRSRGANERRQKYQGNGNFFYARTGIRHQSYLNLVGYLHRVGAKIEDKSFFNFSAMEATLGGEEVQISYHSRIGLIEIKVSCPGDRKAGARRLGRLKGKI